MKTKSTTDCYEPDSTSTPLVALKGLTHELRTLVAGLRTWRAMDSNWLKSIQAHCNELGERLLALAGSSTTGCSLRETTIKLAGELQQHAAGLSEEANARRLRTMRRALASYYEELVAQLQRAGVWSDNSAHEAPPLPMRFPRLFRIAVHVALGLTAMLFYHFLLTRGQALIVLGTLTTVFIGLEITRRIWPSFNDFLVDKIFGLIVRPRERYEINSATYYLMALLLIALVATKPAACVALLVLAIGDPVAAAVGHRFGRRKIRREKSYAGTLAFVAAASIAATVYLIPAVPALSLPAALGIALLAATVGAVAELFGDRLDDNFGIPVAVALVISLVI